MNIYNITLQIKGNSGAPTSPASEGLMSSGPRDGQEQDASSKAVSEQGLGHWQPKNVRSETELEFSKPSGDFPCKDVCVL